MGITTVCNFEDGTKGHFDVETDTNGGLDVVHYTDLAKVPGMPMPYRGAYCAKIDLATASTAGAWYQETGSWDCTAGTEDIYIGVRFFLSKDAAMSNNDVFELIGLWSSTNTHEAVAAIKYTTAAGWQIGIGETAPTSLVELTLGQWHHFEMYVDVAGSSSGTIDGWLDGKALTQVGSLTQADITSGIVGANPGAAFTPTAGTLVIDEVVASQTDNTSTRLGTGGERFPETQLLVSSGHVFVGPGIVDNISLLSGAATDNVLTVYDTDRADTINRAPRFIANNIASSETPVDGAGFPLTFTRGCYVTLSGTSPRGMVLIRRATSYGSDGAIRNYAARIT